MLRILIIRFSSIGDIVLTTPVVRCLKLQKKAEIHYLTKKSYASILEANPYIDRVHTIDKKVTEVASVLKEMNFDYVIDLHKNLRSRQVKMLTAGQSFSFNKLNIEKWLLVNLKINKMPALHIVDRYMDTLHALGVENDAKGLDYFVPNDTEPVRELLGLQYFAFAVGAAHATKRMPTKKIISICQKIKAKVVLLGGPGDAPVGKEIEEAVGTKVINLCGKISLHQSACVVRDAQAVITHDTGMMHIAAAFNKPIASIWGNTVPEFGMTPYYATNLRPLSEIVDVKGLSCRPCSKIGHSKCPKGHFDCMNKIEEDKVLSFLTSYS